MAAGAAESKMDQDARLAGSPAPDLTTPLAQPLLNREHATAVMEAAGVDAILLSHPVNVYYATNRIPATDRGKPEGGGVAVILRDPKRPVAYVGALFEYYYVVADYALAPGVEPFLVHQAANGARGMFRDAGEAPLSAQETHRRQATTKVGASTHETRAAAVAAALGPLARRTATVAVDNLAMAAILQEAAPLAGFRPAEDLMRRIRLRKTPAEIALMRTASAINVEAALATARAVREEGSLRRVRARFFAEAARRGGTGVFMVVDGVLAEPVDRELEDGAAILVDCVSQCAGYHGDFARTVFMGEPRAPMRRVTEALGAGWDEVRSRLKPGVSFSEIHAHGVRTMKQLGYDYDVAFGPHSVGLYHTDQPLRGIDGEPEDLVLQEGMIVSVDCPLVETGLGGTAHLEDLTLITATGSEPIHATGDRVIVV